MLVISYLRYTPLLPHEMVRTRLNSSRKRRFTDKFNCFPSFHESETGPVPCQLTEGRSGEAVSRLSPETMGNLEPDMADLQMSFDNQ